MPPLNLIVICADTFRRDYLGCYGASAVETPHLDRFAESAVRFDNAYAEALPTIEARRVYFTGRPLIPLPPRCSDLRGVNSHHLAWAPMDNDVWTLAEHLRDRGYRTALATDLLHIQKPWMNFHRGFQHWEFVRGQETDPWRTAPRGAIRPSDHIQPHLCDERYERMMGQYLANTRDWRGEEDTFCARVCRRAAEYVEDLAAGGDPFLLWVDLFDPHEPFDPPPAYLAKYWRDPLPTPGRYLFGYGVDSSRIRPEDVPLIRACYSAEVTLVDRWIGHLLETIRLAGLMDNTVIVFTSDHGTEFHEHGVTMKHYFALYDTTTGLPLLIRHPDPATAGRTVDSLVSAVDFMPSWLSLIGAEPPAGQCPGIDFSPRLFGDSAPEREFCPIAYDGYGAARSRDWLYMFPLKGVEESYPEGEYDMRLVGGERLYDLKADPMQQTNLAGARPEMCRAMLERFASVWPEQA